MNKIIAPMWKTQQWFNTSKAISLESLRGKVVMLHAFQMLCPGCVLQALPQAKRVSERFRDEPLEVIGLHSVFEHHEAMTPTSLEAFLYEYRIPFPVAVDMPGSDGSLPETMKAYHMQGTPTTILIDAEGNLRKHVFGVHDDLQLGWDIASLIGEIDQKKLSQDLTKEGLMDRTNTGSACQEGRCSIQ